MDNKLSQMKNIGKILADKLAEAEIDSPDKLKIIGAEKAFIKLKTLDPDICINMLYALEGAIQDIRWHNLDKTRKEELKVFEKMLNK